MLRKFSPTHFFELIVSSVHAQQTKGDPDQLSSLVCLGNVEQVDHVTWGVNSSLFFLPVTQKFCFRSFGVMCSSKGKKKKEIYYQIVKFGMKSPSHSFTTGNFSGCYGPTCNTSWQQYLSSLQFSLRALGPHLYTFSNIFLAQSLETIKRLGLHFLKGRSWTDDKGRQ